MKLYHYTSNFHIEAIMQNGLSRGDVPITPTGLGENAVWFSTSPEPTEQGWVEGSIVDKTQIRITVNIPLSHPNLKKWTKYAAKRLDPEWRSVLNHYGGGTEKQWYIYFGVVPPAQFVSIDYRTAKGYTTICCHGEEREEKNHGY